DATETLLSQRNITANLTILSGDLHGDDAPNFANNADNSYHVVTGSGTDATAVLDGFTIQAVNSNGGGLASQGGGCTIISGSPTLARCTFTGNTSVQFGGGIYASDSAVSITNCRFLGNFTGDAFGGGFG